ncbi:MAG: hypothetical protein ACR2MZ_12040 [Candidatus Dormibacter sp.]|uniref:glycosyl-4,4'-diaponeurosporenoate acyltransferase CrtO family protein n=1 Tax=Candidatus Dormibacter sp. TaxID=2973982 RepID=UPI003D9B436F
MASLSELLFAPKRFESERMYERLGVRRFQCYVPTGGRLVMRLAGLKWIGFRDNDQLLPQLEFVTRYFEAIHWLALPALTALAFHLYGAGRLSAALLALALLAILGFTVHPIMLQRYNRIRLRRAQGVARARRQCHQSSTTAWWSTSAPRAGSTDTGGTLSIPQVSPSDAGSTTTPPASRRWS